MTSLRIKLLCLIAELAYACAPAHSAVVDVWFAPDDDCESAIVSMLDQAEHTIDVQAYAFTSKRIADALIDARGRRVNVRLLVDRAVIANESSQHKRCKAAGCIVREDAKHPIAHNKVWLVDNRILLCGSYNGSEQAKRNAENLMLCDGPEVKRFADNFERHWEHAQGGK